MSAAAWEGGMDGWMDAWGGEQQWAGRAVPRDGGITRMKEAEAHAVVVVTWSPGRALVLDASSAVAGGVRGVINTLDCSDAAEGQNRTEQHSTFTRVRVWVYYLLFVVVVAKPPDPCPHLFPR